MREIIFRGKRIDNGEWTYGVPAKDELGETVIVENVFECGECDCRGAECLYVDENSIGEYTGLTDKNGTKIFEGDIIHFEYVGKARGVEGTEAVIFRDCKFGVLWGSYRELVTLTGFANTTLEVIGNIHDNPELMKGEQG